MLAAVTTYVDLFDPLPNDGTLVKAPHEGEELSYTNLGNVRVVMNPNCKTFEGRKAGMERGRIPLRSNPAKGVAVCLRDKLEHPLDQLCWEVFHLAGGAKLWRQAHQNMGNISMTL